MSVWQWDSADIPSSDVPLPPVNRPRWYRALLHQVSLTVGQCRRTQFRCTPTPPLINPGATEPYYTMSVWHVGECRHTQVRYTPAPLLIDPSGTDPYYTMSVWQWDSADVPSSDVPLPPINQPRCYRALLHHVSLTCGRMQTYPGQMYHPPINTNGTEPYYTMSVCHLEECRCIQVRCNPPLLIKPRGTEPYYTKSVWHVEESRCTKVRCTPHPLIKPSGTEHYYTMSNEFKI